ncbi:acyltransferase domain-containing protein [Dactylosporangium sp. NPDC005572]|uniref:acyltransferase domain-containing protein n=1 Tax=Dactylosporangium sp. NPDC005572 TaxID=3156889 RepID=UPI00339F0A21
MSVTVVFPGQGCQRAGMGADFARRYPIARETFEEAGDAVGLDLMRMCFEPDARLHLTAYTQPCVLAAEIAAYRVVVQECDLTPDLFGGHSLGEYAALVAAGAMPFADAVGLVHVRGTLMQQAVPEGQGAMAALLLDDIAASGAVQVAEAAGAEVANHNSPEQVVISGDTLSVERARLALARSHPALTFMKLKVSAPFHSSLMRPASDEFASCLRSLADRIDPARAAVVASNFTGALHRPDELLGNLVGQLAGPVRWLDNMRLLTGAERTVLEIGPRSALAKFFGAIGTTVTTITGVADLSPLTRADAASLGDPGFARAHGTRLAYAVGGLPLGITSPALVARLAGDGLLGYLGTAGLDPERVEDDVRRLRAELPAGAPWGVSVARDPHRPTLAPRTIERLLELGVDRLEVTGYAEAAPELVRYRLAGDGGPNRLLARVGDVGAAAAFLGPPPPQTVQMFYERGVIDEDQARRAADITMADDVCVDAAAPDAPPLATELTLLPAVARRRAGLAAPVRIGVAGALGTPAAVAAAFALGADFVLTGPLNQCSPEAGLSDRAKDMLAAAGPDDFTTAPAAEDGQRERVLRRGTFFPARAEKLHTLGDGGAALDPAERERIERQFLTRGLDELADAPDAPGAAPLQAALRFYLADALRRACAGEEAERLNYRIVGGPEVGEFNEAVRGTPLEPWSARHVDDIARHLMDGAAWLLQQRGQ